MRPLGLPKVSEQDRPKVGKWYWVTGTPWWIKGEIAHAEYVGEIETETSPLPMFRVPGSDRLFEVGNPYMIRESLETLKATMIAWAERDLLRFDPVTINENIKNAHNRIEKIRGHSEDAPVDVHESVKS